MAQLPNPNQQQSQRTFSQPGMIIHSAFAPGREVHRSKQKALPNCRMFHCVYTLKTELTAPITWLPGY